MAERTVSVRLLALTSTYQAAMAKATASTRALAGTMAATEVTTKGINKSLSDLGFRSKVGLGLAAVGVYAVGKALMSSVNAAIEFESSFAGVRKTVEATDEELEELALGMRQLATEIPVDVNELNRIGELGGQLGIAKENLLDFTRVVALMGVTTDLTVEDAATRFAQLANITQMPQDQFDNLASAVVDLGNKSAATEPEIVEFGQRIAGAGEIAGFTEAEILGIATAIVSLGVQAEAGGTAVQKVMLKITESVALGDAKLATFAETSGMSAQTFAAMWESNPAEAFTRFVEGLGASGTDAIGILKELGLTDQRLTRAFLSLGAAGDDLRNSIETGNLAWEENNALTEEAAKRFETTESKLQLANNQIEEAKIAFGEGLAVALGDAAQGFTDVMLAEDRMMESLQSSFNLMGAWSEQVDGGTMSMDEFRTRAQDLLAGGQHSIGTLKELASAAAAVDEAMANGATVSEAFEQVLGEAADSTVELTEEQREAGATIDKVTGEIVEQITALDRLKGASGLLSIQDAVVGIRDAQLRLADSQRALNELERDGKKGTRDYRDALRDKRDAALGALKAQMGLSEAVETLREKVDAGEVSIKDAVSLVRHFGTEAGLSDRFVDGLIDKVKGLATGLDGLPRQAGTKIDLKGADAARHWVDGWAAALRGVPSVVSTTFVVTRAGGSGGVPLMHSGGRAGSAGARRVGGGLRKDEIPTILQRGEMVLSKAQIRDSRPTAPAGPMSMSGRMRIVNWKTGEAVMEGVAVSVSEAQRRDDSWGHQPALTQ